MHPSKAHVRAPPKHSAGSGKLRKRFAYDSVAHIVASLGSHIVKFDARTGINDDRPQGRPVGLPTLRASRGNGTHSSAGRRA
jgi:hypothetical protein